MKKSTAIVVAVFLGLVGGAVWLVTTKGERGITRFGFEGLDPASVDKVVLAGKNPAELTKDGDGWKLGNGRLADVNAVKRLTDSLPKLKSSDLSTQDSTKFADLEVDDEKGTKVSVFSKGKELASFVMGKNATGGSYVRVGDSVFRVTGVAPALFAKPTNSWIEHKLLTDKVDDAMRVEVHLAGQAPYVLMKKDNAWGIEDASVLPKGFRFDADLARSVAMGVANLRAKDFEEKDPGEVAGLGDTADTITVLFQPTAKVEAPKPEGDAAAAKPEAAPAEVGPAVTRVVRLGAKKEGGTDVYAKIDGKADVFTLAEAAAKSLKKAPTDFRDLKIMKVDKDKVQKLAIVDGKTNLSFEKKDGVWKIAKSSEATPKDFDFDPMMVERRLGAFINARALHEADAKAATGLSSPSAKVTVTVEGGKTATLAFGKDLKEDNKDVVFAQGNADGASYVVAKWTRQSLTGGLATFKKQAEPPGGMGGFGNLDPKALSSLPPDVRQSLMQQMQQKQREQAVMKQMQDKLGNGGAAKKPN